MNRKAIAKRIHGKCSLCGLDDVDCLDVHRIVPGAVGGKYNRANCLIVCSNCHRKIHAGQISVLGRHFSTTGKHVVHFTENGVEKWV
jgi:hypothetical protein